MGGLTIVFLSIRQKFESEIKNIEKSIWKLIYESGKVQKDEW